MQLVVKEVPDQKANVFLELPKHIYLLLRHSTQSSGAYKLQINILRLICKPVPIHVYAHCKCALQNLQ